MIPVEPAVEPDKFDDEVRTPGLAWISTNKLDPKKPVPSRTKIPPLWRKCAADLRRSYSSVCAYSSMHIHLVTGAPTVEHYAPKSKNVGLAFEWSNYRFVCQLMNSRKSCFEDVLDPFLIQDNTFALSFLTGEIEPGASVGALVGKCRETIKRLRLNQEHVSETRLKYYKDYIDGEISKNKLKEYAPFVYYEAVRQGVL